MNADQYLKQARMLETKIQYRMAEVDSLRTQAEGVKAIRYDLDKVQSSPSSDHMADAVASIIETEQEVGRLIAQYTRERNEIIKTLERLTDPTEYSILYMYYIEGQTLVTISEKLNYSYNAVGKHKKRALAEIQQWV